VATRTAVLLAVCGLIAGIAGGWSIHRVQRASVHAGDAAAGAALPAANPPVAEPPSAAQLRQIADSHAAPLLDQLKGNPADQDVLVKLGNIYYDAQQYPVAVDYYARALRSVPSNAAVRTDMATAFWYMGNADTAIAEFDKALRYEPTNPNTLFNLGLVRWKGKHDGAGALNAWQKLLANNPNYEAKDKVVQMIAEVKQPRQ
jgi:cytochrome c-type biogenesis protein CcmH/NrfG